SHSARRLYLQSTFVCAGVLPACGDIAGRTEVGNEIGVVARTRTRIGIASLARIANRAHRRRSAGTLAARTRRDSPAVELRVEYSQAVADRFDWSAGVTRSFE